MINISTFWYSIRQGVKNIYRNRLFSLASAGTITACLFVFGIFYFIISNFQYMIKNAETNVGITVFFDEDIEDSRIKEIGEKMKERPEVDEVIFTSGEEAWEKFQKEVFKEEEGLAESFGGDNPLAESASYEVRLNNVDRQKEFTAFAEKLEGVRQVNSSDKAARTLSSVNMLIGYVSGAVIMILLGVSVFLISTTVTMGISVRKDEISIMRLVGATDFFVRAPFIVEGIIIGFIGTVIPLGILYAIYNNLITYITGRFSVLTHFLTFLEAGEVFRILVPAALFIGIGIGFAGSFVTVRKHLKI